jgi:hypothetical protein
MSPARRRRTTAGRYRLQSVRARLSPLGDRALCRGPRFTSPAPVASRRESFDTCPAARLPIAAAAPVPSRVSSVNTRKALAPFGRASSQTPMMQEGRRNVALVRRYRHGACSVWTHLQMENCCGHHDLAWMRASMMRRRTKLRACFCGAAPARKNPKRHAAAVLTPRDRAAYIGGSRCAVRLGITARLRSSSPIRA